MSDAALNVAGTIGALVGLGLVGAALANRKTSPTSNPTMKPAELQTELLQGLTAPPGGIDAHDFVYLVNDYLEKLGEEEVDDGTSWIEEGDHKAEFEKWLKDTNQLEKAMRDEPADIPAYYWFSHPKPLPKGTWLIHHSDKDFAAFDRGTTWDHLQFTWSAKEPSLVGKDNLEDNIGSYERVYAFAFVAEGDECVTHRDPVGKYRCSGRRPKYGASMLLFQCDAAVEAYHWGDQEDQVLFAIGTEYNEHRITGDSDGSWWVEDPNTGEDVNLETLEKVQELLSRPKKRSKRAAGGRR